MGLDERIFQWFSNRLRRRQSREQRARTARAALTEPLLPRLRNVAAAVADSPLDVALVDGPGIIVGDLVLFPRAMDALPTPADNEALLVLFAAFAGAKLREQRRLHGVPGHGDHHDHDPHDHHDDHDDGADVAAFRALLRVGDVANELSREMPGYGRDLASLAPMLLAGRPAPTALQGRAAVLEHLVRRRLGRSDEKTFVESRSEIAALLNVDINADINVEVDGDGDGDGDGDIEDLVSRFRNLGKKVSFALPPCWGLMRRGTAGLRIVDGSLHSGTDRAVPTGITTEREGRKRPPPRRRRQLQEHKKAENPFTHSFEKVHTAETYQGGQKRADGSDELADHATALDEVELEETVLSSESVASVYNAGASADDVDDGASHNRPHASTSTSLRYDEWDPKRRRYLPGYCRVTSTTGGLVDGRDLAAGAALHRRVRHEERRAVEKARSAVLGILSARRWQRRQLDGPEVDIDAAIDRITTVRAGHEGSRHVYQTRRRAAREVAVLVLLDASLSTDGWVDNRRVLDVERDAAAIVNIACDGLVDEIGVAAFFSDTHEDCRYLELRAFDEPWSVGAARLARLAPAGYTRLGPAIRHGVRQLAGCRARRRLLIILTDGKPGDRDRYEGQHGEGDVRQAVREAAADKVDVLALGADPRAAATLRAMCGRHSVAGLSCAGDVANAVADAIAIRLQR